MGIDGIVGQCPGYACRIQGQHTAPVAGTVHRGPAKQCAPIERKPCNQDNSAHDTTVCSPGGRKWYHRSWSTECLPRRVGRGCASPGWPVPPPSPSGSPSSLRILKNKAVTAAKIAHQHLLHTFNLTAQCTGKCSVWSVGIPLSLQQGVSRGETDQV